MDLGTDALIRSFLGRFLCRGAPGFNQFHRLCASLVSGALDEIGLCGALVCWGLSIECGILGVFLGGFVVSCLGMWGGSGAGAWLVAITADGQGGAPCKKQL